MERRTPAQILNLRSRLTRALLVEPPTTVSAAQDRILAQGFFEPPATPLPAPVISILPRLPASRP